jgi:hypothetical protein
VDNPRSVISPLVSAFVGGVGCIGMHKTRHAVLRLSFALLVLLAPTTHAQSVRPTSLEDLIDRPRVASLKLSPDGRRVAGIETVLTPTVVVTDLDDRKRKVIARWTTYRTYVYGRWPVDVNWIDNDLLAVDFSTRESFAIDLDGKQVNELGERFLRRMSEEGTSGSWVLVYRDLDDGDLDLVNARTGERVKFKTGLPGKLIHGAFDASGALRAVTMMDTAFWSSKTKVSNWYRADERSEWQLLEEAPITDELWRPLRVLSEPDSLGPSTRGANATPMRSFATTPRHAGRPK